MALYEQLLGLSDPKIEVHAWSKAFSLWKRSRIDLTVLLAGPVSALHPTGKWGLTDKTEEISVVAPGTDKLGLSIAHTWADDDGVYLTTTGAAPGGLATQTVYYVRDSNPGAGTVKVAATKGGAAIDITSEGTGTHTLNRVDADVIHWEETRLGITSTGGVEDRKHRRITYDQLSEGILEVAEIGLDFTTVVDLKAELENAADWLTVT